MKKNGLKNFIFSFLLSLLAVVLVNKGVFHTPKTNTIHKKISKIEAKPISLFSKKTSAETKPKADFSGIEELTVAQNTTNTEILQIDVNPDKIIEEPILDEKPLIIYQPEIAQNDVTKTQPVKIVHSEHTDLALATEIVLEKEIKVLNSVNKDNKPAQIAYADISDTIADEESLNKAQAQIVYKPDEPLIPDNKLTVALDTDNTINEDLQEEIPLMASSDILHENIDVMTSAENTQIAMLEPNTLISTIEAQETFEPEEDKSVSEVNLKQDNVIKNSWTQMSAASESDSPWVVAKGNRFAKNKIAQFDALEEEREKERKEKSANSEIVAEENTIEQNVTVEPEAISEEVAENNVETVEPEVITEEIVEQNIAAVEPEEISDQSVESNGQETETSENNVLSNNNLSTPESFASVQENKIVVHQKTSEIEAKQTIDFEANNEDNFIIDERQPLTDYDEIIVANTDTEQSSLFKEEKESLLEPKPLLVPSGGTKLARQMMQNLIIPIPEDIMNDVDAVPMLSADPGERKKETPDLKKEEKESGLFKSITSWFSDNDDEAKEKDKSKKQTKDDKPAKKKKKKGFSLFDNKKEPSLESDNNKNISREDTQIMPAELKLSFQPNRAEISGHTLKWIHAFADNARDNHGIYIEIRIDGTSSFTLQQKRLNLLSTIFANRGVDFRKVNIVFTSREPNSFIIRNIRFNNSEEVIIDQEENPAYQRW